MVLRKVTWIMVTVIKRVRDSCGAEWSLPCDCGKLIHLSNIYETVVMSQEIYTKWRRETDRWQLSAPGPGFLCKTWWNRIQTPGWPDCALRNQEIGSIWLKWWMCGEEKLKLLDGRFWSTGAINYIITQTWKLEAKYVQSFGTWHMVFQI